LKTLPQRKNMKNIKHMGLGETPTVLAAHHEYP